jgi:hypothetical protein
MTQAKQSSEQISPGPDTSWPVLAAFVNNIADRGYEFRALDRTPPDFAGRYAYLRHDVSPTGLTAGLLLAQAHERLRVPATFHLPWDVIEGNAGQTELVRRFCEFDPRYVQLGLRSDPISRWLVRRRFWGSERRLNQFLRSPTFPDYLRRLSRHGWRKGEESRGLRTVRSGAWKALIDLERSFRVVVAERFSSVSGRGSTLANAYAQACDAEPELAKLAPWFNPIDFIERHVSDLGYPFEATRFAPDGGAGPTVIFGGADVPEIRRSLEARIGDGHGFVAIFPAQYWEGERYANLFSPERVSIFVQPPPQPWEGGADANPAVVAPSSAAKSEPRPVAYLTRQSASKQGALPHRPVLTNFSDLTALDCERVSTQELVAAARRKVGDGIDRSFPLFVERLRSEGYSFEGFENGPPRFGERRAYLRYDVHTQDLLAAYVLADLHVRFGIIGSFQITWDHSPAEREARPYFAKLLEFDRRYVQFGLHAAPTSTWFIDELHRGDAARANQAVTSDQFVEWVHALYEDYQREKHEAPVLQAIREGADAALDRIAASFRETFGTWRSISGHGSLLWTGFDRARTRYPQVRVLEPYFNAVPYLQKFGVTRFGFDIEITAFSADFNIGSTPSFPILFEGVAEEIRQREFRTRLAHGAGFVALFHPASWTCRQNASFFLPSEANVEVPNPAGIDGFPEVQGRTVDTSIVKYPYIANAPVPSLVKVIGPTEYWSVVSPDGPISDDTTGPVVTVVNGIVVASSSSLRCEFADSDTGGPVDIVIEGQEDGRRIFFRLALESARTVDLVQLGISLPVGIVLLWALSPRSSDGKWISGGRTDLLVDADWPHPIRRIAVVQNTKIPLHVDPAARDLLGSAMECANCIYLSYGAVQLDRAGSVENPRILFMPLSEPVDLLLIKRGAGGLFPNAFTAAWLATLLADREVKAIAIERQGENSEWREFEDSLCNWLPGKVDFTLKDWIRISHSPDLQQNIESLPSGYPLLHRAYWEFCGLLPPDYRVARTVMYSLWGASRNSLLLERIAASRQWGPNPVIIDVGGGWGFLGLEMVAKGWTATVIDRDLVKVELGRWLARRASCPLSIDFHREAMEALPEHGFPSAARPQVVSFFQSLLFADRQQVADILRTAFDWLASGGALIIVEWTRTPGEPLESSDEQRFTPDELMRLVAESACPPKLVSLRDGSEVVEFSPALTAIVAYKPPHHIAAMG